ncbi:MAG: hypothetical protein KC486_01835, partial [Myxococcales bacterium]|nr:hypothetical protein [Myxococcales bacterium]
MSHPARRLAAPTLGILALASLLAGCNGDDVVTSETASASEGSLSATATMSTTMDSGSDSASATESTTQDSGSESASESGSSTSTTSTSETSTTTTGETSTTTTTTDGTSTTDGVTVTDTDTDGTTTTGGNCDMQQVCGDPGWSYAWIANSSEHTVSKIDTRDVVELARYRTRPDGSGSPSRTSVSIDGRAVAVANRFAGLTKIWSRPEDCVDKNNNGMIDTSTGPNDVLPFDNDECIAWHNPFSDFTVQRPVAWTSGVYNEETCQYENQKIWTLTGDSGSPGQCGQTGIWVHRVNGDSGDIEDTVHIPHNVLPCTIGNIEWGLGPYGAAVDPDNNLWFYVWAQGKIARVDHETLEYEVFSGGSYGITVDTKGRVWDDVPRRFNYQTKTWDSPIGQIPGNGGSGVAEDLQGRIWSATQGGVGWVDSETMVVGDIVPLPGNYLYRGIGVDVDGYIWAVQLGGTQAYKIDPDTYETWFVDGLNGPYTYSDMTGGQIA